MFHPSHLSLPGRKYGYASSSNVLRDIKITRERCKKRTCTEIGKEFNLSVSRVGKIHERICYLSRWFPKETFFGKEALKHLNDYENEYLRINNK